MQTASAAAAAGTAVTAAATIPVLNRAEQQRHYGLDCGDAVRFDAGTWAPGGEHVRKIVVRNVSTRTIKFKYELPTTKYFSMDFPTVLTLSPGMQTVLDVAFRPVKLDEYDDSCVFHVHVIEGGVTATSGKFRLPVVARIAALSIDLPLGLDFGFCPTSETTRQRFELRNNGQIDVVFDWTVAGAGEHGAPFAVHPASGRVRAGEVVELTASFRPVVASVYVTTSACRVRSDDSNGALATAPQQLERLVKISGISKFAHLACSESELHFGDIFVGASTTARAPTEREFVLRNRSLVRARFAIARAERDVAPVFVFEPLTGVVPPESTLTIKVRYTPLSAGTFTCDHYDIRTPGGHTVRLACKGRAVGPRVSLWTKPRDATLVETRSLNFQDVAVGASTARVLTLRNASPVDVLFHFSCQPHGGAFHFDCVAGRVAPFLDLNVTVSFAPAHAGNFYRRIFVLLQNQSPLFVDVLGTGYDDTMRPAPFQQAHIDASYRRARAGLAQLNPDELKAYWHDHGDDLFLQGALRRIKAADEQQRCNADASVTTDAIAPLASELLTRSGEAALADVAVCHEFFVNSDDEARNAIVVHGAALDFGSCSIGQLPTKQTLSVVNTTHGKVTCTWRVVPAARSNTSSSNAADDLPFNVFPPCADIAAGARAEFRVAFTPTQRNAYYFAELEGVVSFKSNRTFRLVHTETFAPPWCVVATASGDTFASLAEQFLATLAFRLPDAARQCVHFAPCYVGDCVFQTIVLENASDTPAVFTFAPDTRNVFACKPARGYVAAKSFQLVQLRFAPRHVRAYTHALQCVVNNAHARPETVELTGIGALPTLAFDGDSVGSSSSRSHKAVAASTSDAASVFIKPTAVGLESARSITLANASRVPLVFRWNVPRQHQDVFKVAPKLGRLNGNERVDVACTFAPTDVRAYNSRFTVAVKPISVPWRAQDNEDGVATTVAVLHESIVTVQTTGTIGAVQFEPATLAFETILVHTSARQSFCIVNVADCDLQFALHQRVHVEPASTGTTAVTAAAAGHLAFSESSGCIAARSRKTIVATFLPRVAAKFTFDVACDIATGNNSSSHSDARETTATSRLDTCTIHAEASFPTVVVDDIRVPQLSSHLAWHQFQCHELNAYLSAPLTRDEELAAATTSSSSEMPRSSRRVSSDDAVLDDNGSGASTDVTLRRFAVPFSPAPLGSPPERVFLQLRNPGALVVQFRLRYPKEGDVEIEHWAETSAPSSDEVRLNAIIDSGIFHLAPRCATLQPHESILLALSYAYTSDAYGGQHDLPIYLEVDKGKRLVLELQGRTLARGEPKLFVPQRVFELSPVMIGEHARFVPHSTELRCHSGDNIVGDDGYARPPVQQIEVFNRGESAFRLEVGSNACTKVNADQYGYPVLQCTARVEIVPAKSSVFLDIAFNPIVAGRVEVPVILKAHGLLGRDYKEAVMLTVVATGYHPQLTTLARLNAELAAVAAATCSEPPRQQLAVVPGQPARFVSDFVDLGHVPTYTLVHALVILENALDASDNTSPQVAGYEWDTAHALVANGTLAFTPASGELAPGESALVRVAVQTSGNAVVVNHDVACFVTYRSASSGAATSPTKTSSRVSAKLPLATELKPRASVINRSTATQEAAGDSAKLASSGSPSRTPGGAKASLLRKPLESSKQLLMPTRSSERSSSDVTDASDATPLFVRIYAHVLPQHVFEKRYSREAVTQMPVPLVPALPAAASRDAVQTPLASSSMPASTRTARSALHTPLTAASARSRTVLTSATGHASSTSVSAPFDTAACRDVLYDVLDALVVDVLNSSAVQDALERQATPLPASTRALVHAGTSRQDSSLAPLLAHARESDDCQSILAGVLENTVRNVLHELFHGDLERELMCVPRASVFPTATTTTGTSSSPTATHVLSM